MKKILILEGGRAISNMISNFNESENYKVLLSVSFPRNGGNLKLPGEIPDLVIADLTSIKKEKVEFLMLLKSNPVISMIPFLLITSNKGKETPGNHTELRENFPKQNYYLNKPFSKESLLTLVMRILKQYESISPW